MHGDLDAGGPVRRVPDHVLMTERLLLRELNYEDAGFILRLLNDDSFKRFIGDKSVRTLADACGYLQQGPLASYARHGFGLYLASLREGAEPIGICGLVKRETLADVDVGYAFLPEYWSRGYATESAAAVLEFARERLGLGRVVAITAPDNEASIAVLLRIGMSFDRLITLEQGGSPLKLYVSQ